MQTEVWEDQAILLHVNWLGQANLMATAGDHLPAALPELPEPVPSEPGIYVWEGSVHRNSSQRLVGQWRRMRDGENLIRFYPKNAKEATDA